MQKSRFTASKPSIFAIASDEKFIRHLVTSFHQRSLSQSQYQNDPTKPNFGTLTATTYGNGAKIRSRYDDFNRVTGVVYGEETAPRYEYDYNAKGQVARVRDNLLNRTTQSEYDLANRPVRVKTAEAGQHVYTGQVAYDNVYGNLSEFTEKVGENRQEYGTKFGYDDENRPTSLTYSVGATTIGQSTTTIDKLNRTTFSAVKLGSKTFTSEYHFAAGGYGTGSVTNLVSSITQPGCNCGYGYDDNGNIASATLNGKWTGYTYDALGQLIRVNDRSDTSAGDNGSTWVYEYDRGGNILSKKLYPYENTSGEPLQTTCFSYGNANWKDQLTAVDGTPITYDAIGNPLNDGTWTYTWQNGRQLQKMQKSGVTAEFVYNADGLRVQKTVNGVATKYTLHGKNIVHMTSGTDELHFFYDAQNRPAMVVYNGTAYAYVKSLQGDIVAILDESGNTVVSYGYDAWGAPLWCTGELAETLGKVQPFRYRGYVFDEETGLYYLRSRYYNPQWGRFVNADAHMSFSKKNTAYNLYSYCNNSVTTQKDIYGTDPEPATQEDQENFEAFCEAYKRSTGREYTFNSRQGKNWTYTCSVMYDVEHVNGTLFSSEVSDAMTVGGGAVSVIGVVTLFIPGARWAKILGIVATVAGGGTGIAGIVGLATTDGIPTFDEYRQFSITVSGEMLVGYDEYHLETFGEPMYEAYSWSENYLYIEVGKHSGLMYDTKKGGQVK